MVLGKGLRLVSTKKEKPKISTCMIDYPYMLRIREPPFLESKDFGLLSVRCAHKGGGNCMGFSVKLGAGRIVNRG